MNIISKNFEASNAPQELSARAAGDLRRARRKAERARVGNLAWETRCKSFQVRYCSLTRSLEALAK